MLLLTDEVGQPVVDANGRKLGRCVELAVDASDPNGRVIWVGVGRGRRIHGWVQWSDVASFETTTVTLAAGTRVRDHDASSRGVTSLWLGRDVLDAQVLDPDGGRLVRVGDIELERGDGELVVTGIAFGWAPLLRRLGSRRLSERLSTTVVPWRELRLVSGRGLTAQLEVTDAGLAALSRPELALLIAQIPTARASEVLDAVGPRHAAAAMGLAHPEVMARLVPALPHEFVAQMVGHMTSNDATDTLREISSEDRQRVLDQVGSERAAELSALLSHPPNSAGGLMSTEFSSAPTDEEFAAVRSRAVQERPAHRGFAGVFVVDDHDRPVGRYGPEDLLGDTAEPEAVVTVRAHATVEEIELLFATHDVDVVAVVDEGGAMIGVISVGDVLAELVAERLPGRRRVRHTIERHRAGAR